MNLPLFAFLFLLSWCAPAAADPLITPLVVAVLGQTLAATAIVTVGAYTLTIGAVVSALVTVALGVGISLLFAPKVPKPENGQVPVQQPLAYRIFAYGTTRLAGATVFKEERAGNLTMIMALTGHMIDQFIGLYLNDDLVTVPISGGLISGFVSAGADGRYKVNTVYAESRLGLATETAYSGVVSEFSDIWSNTCRGDSCASIYARCGAAQSTAFSTIYPYGLPQVSVVANGFRVFDPRDDSQSVTDPTTWKFSKNVALIIMHHQCWNPYGPQRQYATAIAPVLSDWTQAANDCDDEMPLKEGGTEVRYACGGWVTTETDKKSVLQQLLAACDGWFCERGDGTISLQVGKFASPDVTITDDDIAGFFIQTDLPDIDKINEITGSWTSPDCGYTSVETDPRINSADQTSRGGAPRKSRLDLPWVQSNGQASRLLMREFIRQKAPLRGRLDLRLSGLNAAFARWVLITSNTIPRLSNQVIENRKATISISKGVVSIEFIATGSEIDTYDPDTDESTPPTVPQRPYTVGLPIPSNVSVAAEEVADSQGNVTVYLDVSWDEPLYNGNLWNLSYLVQWRIHDAGGGTPGPWTQQSFTNPTVAASRVSVATGTVPIGTILDVQVSSSGTGASLSTASTIVTVDTSAAAPGEPSGLTATDATGGVADLSVTNPTSPVFAAIQFYRSAHGSSFSSAVNVGQPISGSSGGTTTSTDNPGAGTWDYWATAQTAGGVNSAAEGPVSVTVT